MVDKALELFPGLIPSEFIERCSKHYAVTSRYQIFRAINTAFNYYSKHSGDKLNIDSYKVAASENGSLRLKSARSKQAFTGDEASSILCAFESGKYANPGYEDNDTYYRRFAAFLFATGCRPEDAIAVQKTDLNDGFITFNKAYSKGCLKTTKNEDSRQFKASDMLIRLFDDIPSNSLNLVFPSLTGTYINLNTWRTRYWTRIIKGLVDDGLVSRYLPPYHCRHTFISHQKSLGVPDVHIASWVETSELMIAKHYSSKIDNSVIPIEY